jgi:hypothetical protein
MPWDDTKVFDDPILSADWNAMVTDQKSRGGTLTPEQFDGSDCNGSDGATNRVLTTSGASGASGEIQVFADGRLLRKTDQWTLSGDDITFLVKVYNAHKIDVYYLV